MNSFLGRSAILLSLALAGCTTAVAPPPQTPPLAASCAERLSGEAMELSLRVAAEDGREIPITIYAPTEPGTYPLIGFSHGAFAAPGRYDTMLKPLAAAGYIVVAAMHVDSEEFGNAEMPSPDLTWITRNQDMALSLNPPEAVRDALAERGLALDPALTVSMGHSYGALIAQQPGGAIAVERDGSTVDRRDPSVDVVVGWSPPSAFPGLILAEGWNSLDRPSLTITGTTDILPGFIDDWQGHRDSHDNAPVGARALWVGEDIDHYFGGVFGRKKPVDPAHARLFDAALERTLNFIERKGGVSDVCVPSQPEPGEMYEEDGQ